MSTIVDRSHAESVRSLARRVNSLRPTSDAQIANVGFMTGALYALERAIDLGYDDARLSPNPATMATEFAATLTAISATREPPASWLAGFFFHSATMRLAALNERLDRSKDVAAAVRKSVNSLKHEADAHISGRRTVRFDQVLKAAEDLCALLETSVH